jgi:hypothetical protein
MQHGRELQGATTPHWQPTNIVSDAKLNTRHAVDDGLNVATSPRSSKAASRLVAEEAPASTDSWRGLKQKLPNFSAPSRELGPSEPSNKLRTDFSDPPSTNPLTPSHGRDEYRN